MEMDINHYFDLKSCSHRVKIEVKQVDDNYIWLYNENQYLYVELYDNLYPRHPVHQERRISFVWWHRH